MPEYFKNEANLITPYNAPQGNLSFEWVQRDLDGLLIGDIVDFFPLPAGCEPVDAVFIRDGGGAATSILDVGLKGANGTSQDDPDYFANDLALDAAGLVRKTTVTAPVTLLDRHMVQGVIATANIGAGACVVLVGVWYRSKGTK